MSKAHGKGRIYGMTMYQLWTFIEERTVYQRFSNQHPGLIVYHGTCIVENANSEEAS